MTPGVHDHRAMTTLDKVMYVSHSDDHERCSFGPAADTQRTADFLHCRLPPLPLVRAMHISDDCDLDALLKQLFGGTGKEATS